MGVTNWAGRVPNNRIRDTWDDRHTRVLMYCLTYHAVVGRCPSRHEIAAAFEISSSTAQEYIIRLKEDGFLEEQHGRKRTLAPLVEIVAHG